MGDPARSEAAGDHQQRLLVDLARIRLVVFDFDGVFTDNTVYVSEDGRETVRCWRSDGLGLAKLPPLGIQALVISTEVNPVVGARCRKLKLACLQGCPDKAEALERLAREKGLSSEELGTLVAYVGNDINDLGCLKMVGMPVVVNDAHPDVLPLARYRTRAPGGRGAVREVCDLLVAARAAQER
jgi:YrbI family 3-deoxy-D-manno-octulosonate 8-phosphate phosphatase